jgi:quercetin 2,3-dioxygenase
MAASSRGSAVQIAIRPSETLYRASGEIQDGTFSGRWHFGPGLYRDPTYDRFGNLQVFNDDTLSPGATWPLHPHSHYEVVTYVAEGEFRHQDERGKGGVIHQGGTQYTTGRTFRCASSRFGTCRSAST